MKGILTTKRLAFAALASIYITAVTAAAAMPAAIQDTNASFNSSSKCTVYYRSNGDPLKIRGRVRPVVVSLDERNRGKHDFNSQDTILLAFTPDCPEDVFCTFHGDSGRSSPFAGRHLLNETIEHVTSVECGPLVEFADEDNDESGDDGYGKDSQGKSIIRQHGGEESDLKYYLGRGEVE